MDKERRYIVEWIFPRIKELCDERWVEFFPIDLRWGIPEQKGKQGRIIGACLEEIDNSRPFFIGLLGDRYGWQPSLSDLGESSNALLERYPWIRKDIDQRLSITEIEMQYGALRQNDSNAVFYIRKENVIQWTIKMIKSSEYRRLHRLKASIKHNKHVLFREYTSPEELGEMVYQDAKAVIEERFIKQQPKYQEALHEQSFKAHLTNFVNLDTYYRKIGQALNSLTDESRFLALHGMKGAGKSTVLCTFIEKYRNARPNKNILYYDIAKSFMNPLVGWNKGGHLCINAFIYETRRFLENVDKDLAQHSDDANIVAFDNVEYLIPDKHKIFIQELKSHPFPSNTKIIITHLDYYFNPYHTCLEDVTESYISIDDLRAQKVQINGIQREDIPIFVEQYLKPYGKKLNQDQLLRFTKPLYAENPYYLGLALFQLVELGSFEQLDETVNYLTSGDTYFETEKERWNWSVTLSITYILDNVTGRDRKEDWTGDLLSILWLMFRNRYIDGFTERELIDIFHFTPARWALLRPQVLELCRYNNGYIEFADNLFSLILGRIMYENMAIAQEAVIKYYESIPSIDELEENFKKKRITVLNETQKHQVIQSLRRAQLLPWYKHCQEQTLASLKKEKNNI